MTEMAKLILKMATIRAKEHDQIMKAIEAAHKVYPKEQSN